MREKKAVRFSSFTGNICCKHKEGEWEEGKEGTEASISLSRHHPHEHWIKHGDWKDKSCESIRLKCATFEILILSATKQLQLSLSQLEHVSHAFLSLSFKRAARNGSFEVHGMSTWWRSYKRNGLLQLCSLGSIICDISETICCKQKHHFWDYFYNFDNSIAPVMTELWFFF